MGDTIDMVYRYGVPSWFDLPHEVKEQQFFLANRLWNTLVAERVRHAAVENDLWTKFPDVAAVMSELESAESIEDTARENVKKTRNSLRSTVPDPNTTNPLEDARDQTSSLRASLKSVKKKHRSEMNQLLADIGELAEHRCRSGNCASSNRCKDPDNCKDRCHHNCPDPDALRLYDEWTQQGLGWGTINDVMDKFRIAENKVWDAWKNGQSADLKFHRWAGEGTFTVQVQRSNQWAILDGRLGSEWLGRERRIDEKIDEHRRTLRLQVGRGREFGPLMVDIPIVYQRPLPDDAEVKFIRVTRRTVAGQPRYSVQFTVKVPAPEPSVKSGRGIHVTFDVKTRGSDIGVRVAKFGSNDENDGSLLPMPDNISDAVVKPQGGDFWTVVLPARWIKLELAKCDAIRKTRDNLLDEIRPGIVTALNEYPALVESTGFTAAQAKEMGFNKYARLTRVWPGNEVRVTDPKVHANLRKQLREHYTAKQLRGLSTLDLWIMRDRHLWSWEAHMRRQVFARRTDRYRKIAAWIADSVDLVTITPAQVSRTKKISDLTQEDTYAMRSQRSLIQFAAPYELERLLRWACTRRGVTIIEDKFWTPKNIEEE